MRLSFVLALLLPAFVSAQPTAEQRKDTVKWVTALQAPDGGFFPAPQDPKADTKPAPGLRATSAAVRTLKYLGAELPNKDRHAAFVLTCYDPKTGGFAEPGGKPDVGVTSTGVMAAMELGIPKEKFAKAMDYLKENAKTFEEVRIGAAALEAWGVKDCPFDLKPWLRVADEFSAAPFGDAKDGSARDTGSVVALWLRLGRTLDPKRREFVVNTALRAGQRDDGGWGKKGEKASDLDTTYRVMRAFMLLKEKPADVKKLREFLAAHHNKDGGYGIKPGEASNMSGAYYCTIVTKWLDDLEK
jgi:prenyltransferase beta subunit